MANVTVTITGDEQQALAAIERVNNKVREMDANTQKVAASSKGAAQAGDEAFGSGALDKITNYVSGMVSIGAAIGLATKLFTAMSEEATRAGAAIKSATESYAKLSDISGGSAAKYGSLVKETNAFYAAGGAPTIGEAEQVTALMSRAGKLDQLQGIAPLGRAMNLQEAITSSTTIGNAYGAEAGTIKDIISRGVGVSAGAGAGTEEILQSTAKNAEMGKALGWSLNQQFAVIGALSKGGMGKGGVRGALQFEEKALSEFGAGKSPQELIRSLSEVEKQTDEAEMMKFLGGREAFVAYKTLKNNMDFYEKELSAASAAPVQGLADITGRLAETQADESSTILADKLEAHRKIAEKNRGSKYEIARGLREEMNAQSLERGDFIGIRMAGKAAAWAASILEPESFVGAFGSQKQKSQLININEQNAINAARAMRPAAQEVRVINLDGQVCNDHGPADDRNKPGK